MRIELNIQIFMMWNHYIIIPEGFAAPLRRLLSRILLQLFFAKDKSQSSLLSAVTIQILSYEFLGPIRLSEWGPPMEEVLYLILAKSKETFQIIHAGESGKTDDSGFFTKNEKFKCWLAHASEQNLHLCIYPMWGSAPEERQRILHKIISKYVPPCNADSTNID